MRTLEVRRHAQRDPEADRLSEEGRARASPSAPRSRVGTRSCSSPPPSGRRRPSRGSCGASASSSRARRRAGLAAKDNDGSPLAMAGVLSALLDAVPEDGRGLAVSHTP